MGGWVADRRLASEFQAAKDGALGTAPTMFGARCRAASRRPARAAIIDPNLAQRLSPDL